jgi:hypothetical protein
MAITNQCDDPVTLNQTAVQVRVRRAEKNKSIVVATFVVARRQIIRFRKISKASHTCASRLAADAAMCFDISSDKVFEKVRSLVC